MCASQKECVEQAKMRYIILLLLVVLLQSGIH